MIQVEIRGKLTETEREKLASFLEEKGTLLQDQDRQMILLRGYEGFSENSIVREVDIRLRDTNGSCEIMVKRKTADHNVARSEVSLGLKCNDLEEAKQTLKALGYSSGLWMHRKKKVYSYNDVEWSVVEVPEGLSYYEIEKEIEDETETTKVHEELVRQAEAIGLSTLDPDAMRAFIQELDDKVNKEISW